MFATVFDETLFANKVAACGDLVTLKMLERVHNILPDKKGADMAAEKGHMEVLDFLKAHNVHVTCRGVNAAAANGYSFVLETLKHHLDPENFKYAADHAVVKVYEVGPHQMGVLFGGRKWARCFE
jgi:hypothetical protein